MINSSFGGFGGVFLIHLLFIFSFLGRLRKHGTGMDSDCSFLLVLFLLNCILFIVWEGREVDVTLFH